MKCRFDVLEALKAAGYNTARMRQEKLLGENAIQSLRTDEIKGMDTLERICKLLNMQPGDIIMCEEDNETMTKWTKEMAVLAGEVYYDLLRISNKGKHDPFPNSSIWPLKSLVMMRQKIRSLPPETEEKMVRLMDMIDIEDMNELMSKPAPNEVGMWFEYGKMLHTQKKK